MKIEVPVMSYISQRGQDERTQGEHKILHNRIERSNFVHFFSELFILCIALQNQPQRSKKTIIYDSYQY